MKHLFSVCAAVLASFPLLAQSQQIFPKYERLWTLIGQEQFQEAENLITAGVEPDKKEDAYITGLYLKTYRQTIDDNSDFIEKFYEANLYPDPYVYALWFSPAVLGQYGKKVKPHQIRLIDRIRNNPKSIGTLRAAANYQYGMHYLFQNKLDSAQLCFDKIGSLRNWQYVGPFENLSNSGIYKDYGPLGKADPKSSFVSATNAPITWFTPASENADGWIPLSNQIYESTAVAFAQTFVTSPSDQEILCNVGATGAIRVWINDTMIISDVTERVTELDAYTVKCRLQKGVNRILVQIAYTDRGYPNFAIRLTDTRLQPLPGLTGSSVYKPYSKAKQVPEAKNHFAMEFFQNKIKAEPTNVVNYLLLADVYTRNGKSIEARNLLETALKFADNNLLRSKLIDVLNQDENQTVRLEEVDKIRRSDPKAALILDIDIRSKMNTERYTEGMELISEYEKNYGKDFKTLQYRMGILGKQNKVTEIVSLMETEGVKYPDEPKLLQLSYLIKKEIHRDKEAGMKVYEDFLSRNYNYDILKHYIELLKQDGKYGLVEEKLKWLNTSFPQDIGLAVNTAQYYINAKQYSEGEAHLKKALSLSPYHEKCWELLGDIKAEQKKTNEAVAAYQKSLLFDPNQYALITKLRNLLGKPETYRIVPQINVDEIVSRDVAPDQKLTSQKGYYVVCEDRALVMHPGGATEDFNTYIIRITNEKGIKAYKESHINYGSRQKLFIEKFELIKPNGARLRGERNDNQIVFTNLEVGDVIVFQYRFQNFNRGRFADEFWGKHFFQDEAYKASSRYTILLPRSRKLNYEVTNSTLKPTITDVEDFKQYSWRTTDQPGYSDEPYMPAIVDIVPVLHLSTIQSWNEISTWYADLINKSSEETFELTTTFEKLFSAEDLKMLTQFEKARRIYNHIEDNIRYSSVSFRQGAYLPQPASKTIATRLGDCKDLSNLFVKLCEMAGIQARMVLTDTRDNGEKDMVLPSLEFNHAIAKAILDGKEFYIELTDNHLPFTSIPNSLIGALILEIPAKNDVNTATLQKLVTATKIQDVAKANIVIQPKGNDLNVSVSRSRHGHLTSSVRDDFKNLTYDKQLIKLQDYVSSRSTNTTIDTLYFTNLESPTDSLTLTYRYQVKDQVAEIASLKTFKLIFPDVVATSNHFSSPTRVYPINYVAYEDTDYYETTIRVEIPRGLKIVDPPGNVSLSFGGMSYDLNYKLIEPEILLVSRKFTSKRSPVDVKDYTNLKTFLDNIVKAEQRMIAYQ